ncbi:MAG: response regulator [Geminicoccaceae bacterium]
MPAGFVPGKMNGFPHASGDDAGRSRDAEVLIRFALAEFLRDCGYRVLEAASADEASELPDHDPGVHILLTDVQMPGCMNGFGLAQWLRQHRTSVRVIISSGHEHAAREASKLCADVDYLPKPYDPTGLAAVIRRLLSD